MVSLFNCCQKDAKWLNFYPAVIPWLIHPLGRRLRVVYMSSAVLSKNINWRMKKVFFLNDTLYINKPRGESLYCCLFWFLFPFQRCPGVTISLLNLPRKQTQFGPFSERVSMVAIMTEWRIHVLLLSSYPSLFSSDIKGLRWWERERRQINLVLVTASEESTWGHIRTAVYGVRQTWYS